MSSQVAASTTRGGGVEVQRSRGGVLLDLASKRKASEDQREQPEKTNKSEQEERASQRSTDDWENSPRS